MGEPDQTEDAPEALLARLGKDPRLVPYGGGNFGMPLDFMEPEGALVVPTERFFVRSNGPIPEIDPASWRLAITGLVETRLALSLSDLKALPQRTQTAFLECAGNGRSRFEPTPPGTPWRNDAAGNAVWRGVPLVEVLDQAGVREGAVDVVSQGGDMPGMRRGLPLAVARDPETLLVWQMNGVDLPVAHGGPVRLLVPGWAGIASTKWLVGLEVIDRAFDGFWNSDNYVFWTAAGEPVRPIREMPVKSVISSPNDGATVRAGRQVVTGYAWSGYGAIRRVEVSTDGGATWCDATIAGEGGRRSWVRFERTWDAAPGRAHLLVQATDERGLTQPATPEWNAKGYLMNARHEIAVTVED